MAPFIRTPLPLSLLPSSHDPKIPNITHIERKALGAFFPLDPGTCRESTGACGESTGASGESTDVKENLTQS